MLNTDPSLWQVRQLRRNCRPALLAAAFAFASFSLSHAQTAPAASTTSAGREAEETIQLSAFEVAADPDTSYGALQSNSLTAFAIDLEKMPATVQVFTQTFMDDVAATSIEDVLINYTGTVTADPNNTGAAFAMPGDRDGSGGGMGVRGLASGPAKRDGMVGVRTGFRGAVGLLDSFSTERIELVSGPQSLLYGAAGGGGVINTVSKLAHFKRQRGYLRTRIDQYGGKRAELDYNYGTDRVAVRFAAMGEDRRNIRYNLKSEAYGYYTQLAFRLAPRTTLRLYHQRTNTWGNASFNPGINDFLPVGDPRRGQDLTYLALTGQLADLQGKIWDGPVDYEHISSFAAWWHSERIVNKYSGLRLETSLPGNISAQLIGVYGETVDERFTTSKALLPAAGLPGSAQNPFPVTAVRVDPGMNWQSDRTKAVRLNLVHEGRFKLFGGNVRSQTGLGMEYSHQGPAFGSSGIDHRYYLADENWNAVISPTLTQDYGRIPLTAIYFPVQGGIPLRPVFKPGTRRITLNGQNYVLQPRIRQDMSRVTDNNPFGLVPNNPTTANPNGFTGNWNRGGETHARMANLGNFTEWWDGRLTTILGASVYRFETLNAGPNFSTTWTAPRNYWGFQYGATYAIKPWVRAYATLSTAGMQGGTTNNFFGEPLKVPKAVTPAPEVGLRFNTPDRRYEATISYNFTTRVENETRNASADFFNAVNPDGVNGRVGGNGANQWINLDREANSMELTFTANPTRNWRMRLQAVKLDGEISSTVRYNQLYNDEFHVGAGGVVTRANGTPLLVDPVGAGGAATTPLTLAMINNPTSPYYANPDPNSGRIRSTLLRGVLMNVDPTHGSAATGRNGLPISSIQYDWTNPHGGQITVVEAGDKNTGINEYSLNFQNNYTFREGRLQGLSVFTNMRTYYKNRAYYTSYYPTVATGNAFQAERVLHRMPTSTVFDVGLSYRFKLWKHDFTTQLNVRNVLDNSKVWVMPNPANGAQLRARLSEQPRQFIWSNTFAF